MKKTKQTILIVENDLFLANLYKKRFEEVDYQVLMANDGEKGLMLAKKNKPDLILLEVVIPKINGFDVLKKLKKNKIYSNIPVVIFTNLSRKEDIKKAFDLGAKEYLIKFHITPREVIKKIAEVLS